MALAWLLLALQVPAARLHFADRYDDAFAEAKARNVPVLVVDFDGWSTDRNNPQISDFYEDRDFSVAAEGAVLVLASQEDHGERTEIVDGNERRVCSTYGGISCAAHRDVLPKAFADFGKDGQLVSPLFALATPDHKELRRLEHEQAPASLTLLLKQAAKQVGPGLRRTEYVKLKRGLNDVRRFSDLGEYTSAVALCADLRKIPGQFAPQAELAVAERRLEEAGREKLARGDELWSAGRILDALLEMDDVRLSFGHLPPAISATTQMKAWEKTAKAQPHIAALRSDRAARTIYEKGLSLERRGEPKLALEVFEKLLREYPEGRFSNRAVALVAALRQKR